jgi:hypothetical protein
MEYSHGPVVVIARVVIAHLRESVQIWLDGDRILPEEGAFPLATLDRALASVNGEDAPAARAGIEAFIGRVQSLIETGTLEAADGRPPIEMAVALGALLHGAVEQGSTAAIRRTDAGVGQRRSEGEDPLPRGGARRHSSPTERQTKR